MKRYEQIGVRFSEEEKAAVERLAAIQMKAPSAWLRDIALAELGRLLVNAEPTGAVDEN